MIQKLNIGPRLLLLMAIQGVLLLLIGSAAVIVVNLSVETAQSLSNKLAEEAKVAALSENLRSDLVDTVHALNAGNLSWNEGVDALNFARTDFETSWKDYVSKLNAEDTEFVNDVFTPHLTGLREAFSVLTPLVEARNSSGLSAFVTEKLDLSVGPFLDALVANTSLQQLEAESAAASATQFGAQLLYMTVLAVLLGLALAGLLGFLIYRSIVKPLSLIDATVRDVAQGDLLARTGVTGTDELGALGSAFDSMLSERVATLAQAKEENDKLNDSVIGLLEAVSQLSRRDLTVSVPVTEDVTGPVADSLNLLTGETAKVLQGVRDVSALVAAASAQVKSQSDRLINRASAERAQVIQTSETLTAASERMTRIARLAQASTVAGDEAIDSTRTAMERVTGTVSGITDIRDTIRETEKRIKRLGERSQEISGVVDLINSIAERTHILALNASMHAASAGEAGRGFAVVADEVQRLAENAREATSQISTLVGNIQVETSDTVNIMNHVITQVVDGTKLAEQAGKQMEDTRERTASLVAMVQRIAKGSLRQAKTSLELRERAHLFAQSTIDTSAELDEQSTQTDALVAHAARLVESVNVFVLPSVNKPESASVDPERTVVLEHHTDAIVNG